MTIYSYIKTYKTHYKRIWINTETYSLSKTTFLVDEAMNTTVYNDIKNNIRKKSIQIWFSERNHRKHFFSFKIQ